MVDPRELELKLEFDPADRNRLDASELLKSGDAKTTRLVSTYFDTPAGELREAGYSLRVRRQGRQRTQTVKADRPSSAGLFERPEWERPIRGDQPLLDGEGGPLIEEVGAGVLDRIDAVFVTDVKRTIWQIESGGTAIELAIDVGEIRAGN